MSIRVFSEISKTDAGIAGGKGASLGEMTRAGISVPQGFVILAETFDAFLRATDLNVEIEAALETVNTEALHTVEAASEKIRAMILSAETPKDMEGEIEKGFASLGVEFVAVRSSATSEDGSLAAWAGQLDTFLNTTRETLLENVKKCWASLFTPRAIFYRFEQEKAGHLDSSSISVAVVVQKMVQSEISGVAFSVHPVTQDRNQLIIEAGWGLGEAIVSGSITPDSYVVDKRDGVVLDVNVSEQEKMIARKAGGGDEWIPVPLEKRPLQKLSTEQIGELARLVIQIEQHYGFPCDIEWALESGTFFITQSRPITTLSS